MRTPRHSAAAAVALLCLSVSDGADAEVSASKRLLIRELIELSVVAVSLKKVEQLFLAQIRYALDTVVDQVLTQEPDLSSKQREALREELLDFEAFRSAFEERFSQRIVWEELLESVWVPLYDQHFEESELSVLVAFYRTPAGRKTLEVMPQLMREGLARTLPRLEPDVARLVGEILAERRRALFE
jgi:hypothetical protein